MIEFSKEHPERAWSQIIMHDKKPWDSAMLVLVLQSDDGLEVVGNAFVVKDNGRSAICLTAAHNFEYAKRLNPIDGRKSHPTLPADFKTTGTEYVKTEGLFALFSDGDRHVGCNIDQICYIAGYDVALFTIYVSEDEEPLFNTRFALDFGMPQLGDEVAMAAYELELEKIDGNRGHVRRTMYWLVGKVTGVEFGTGRHGQMAFFETTIPIRAGMSGAPILTKIEPGKQATACGLASHDFSTNDAFEKFAVAGNSTAAALWPSVGFALTVATETDPAETRYLAELAERGWIDVVQNDVSVQLDMGSNELVIIYEDKRVVPTLRGQLTTRHHPGLKPG